MPIQITTTLPDEDQPMLGNGVGDEVAVDRETTTTNNGSVRIQIRETGASSWDSNAAGFAEFIGTYDTLAMEFVGREDGGEYEVRARTETPYRTGAWTEPAAIVTQFPGLTGLAASPSAPTTVALTWTDVADNEAGFTVETRRQYEGGWGRWRDVTELVPNVESYEADAPPDTTVEYRVTSYTPYKSVSATVTVTTPAMGLAPRNVSASGWHVEITRPDADGVAEPTILDDVTLNPRLSDKPEVVVPVPYDEQWLDETWERQPVRAWRDGERLPVERVIDTELARGGGSNQVQLYLRGGHDLDARYQDEVRDRSAHNVMRDVLDASGYVYTVDPAPATDGEPFGTLREGPDFRNYADIDESTDPIAVGADTVGPRQTCYLTPLDEIESGTTPIVGDIDNDWSSGNAVEFDVSALRSATWYVDLDHPIPSEHVELWFRIAYDFEGVVEVYIDGTRVGYDLSSSRSNSKAVEWMDMISTEQPATGSVPDLSAGQHSITLNTTDDNPSTTQTLGPAGYVWLDMPALFDGREWDGSEFSDTLTSQPDGLLTGPPGLYSVQTIDFRIQPLQRATGATLDATISDTSNDQAIGVGPIETDIQTNANATSIDRDFSSTRDFIARLTLGGADGDGSGPNDGVEQYYTTYRTVPQTLDELAISYDALGSPSISESIDDSIQEVLTAKAQRANCIWELQWDADAGEPRIVVTQVGQRTSDANPDIAQYTVTKDLSRELSGATVYGKSRDAQGEAFTASLSGTSLANDNLDDSGIRVYDAEGTEYSAVEESDGETSGDYEVAFQDGFISITDDGDMTAGQDYFIDYAWMPVGSTERDVDFSNHRVETLNAIRSDTAAAGAASFLVDELDSPQWEAEVTIPQREAGFNLVNAIAPSQLPTSGDERYEIRSIDEPAGEVSLTLGAHQSASDVLDRIERSLGETAREV